MGPLAGFKIVEIAGIGPGQFCGMLLADMGAQLIRLDRPVIDDLGVPMPARYNLMNRSRPTVAVDLKSKEGIDLVLRLCEDADAIFEGFRPGVMERLGLGPAECMARNERLVYGRMTGYGQEGPLADSVGHDTNYIALAGALHSIGDADRPPPIPLNLIGDFGGGGVYLAMGMLAAMLEASKSGKGQVVDAAMVDGVTSMLTVFYGLMAGGMWQDERQANMLDGRAPFVKVYETRDGKYVAVCAVENRFYRALLDALEITSIDAADQHKQDAWPEQEAIIAEVFRSKTRDEWSDILEGTDSCAAPVLSLGEAPRHVHNEARKVFVNVDGIEQPAPAPRFSRTRSEIQSAPTEPGEGDEKALSEWGLGEVEIERFLGSRTAA
ncbi:CoA transferase [Gammaproteobacteria bacterium]|jgi:alpha-methylacyl-CoA racemase|nr:CoA transferase [Gammaproteobacteria bacterium]